MAMYPLVWGSGLGGGGGGAVDSVNSYTGIVVLTSDDIGEGILNLYYTDDRARLALSASGPLNYDNLTGVFTIDQADTGTDGYLSQTDWDTFNGKQDELGFTPEDVANKATDFSTVNDTLYPSVKAVNDRIVQQLAAAGVFMFSGVSSDIGAYQSAPIASLYTPGSLITTTSSVTTTPTLMIRFATDLGYPNITTLAPGMFVVHYETQKASGSNNYYSYAEIYQRTSGGTETLIATTDNSSTSSVNTVIQVTVSALVSAPLTFLATDRIVVKIYCVMVSSSANIDVLYDDTTDARIQLPYAPISYIPENVSNKSTDGTLAANSSTLYPSQSAVKTYADTKEPAFTKGNLTEATSSVLTITGGTNAVIGSGLSIEVKLAATGQSGYLSSTDWNTFNNKQTATLASANILVGNASNVATAVAMSGDISISNTGATAYAGTVPLNKGGTGQTTKSAAFDALSPVTTLGDVIVGGVAGVSQRLAVGSNGKVLTVNTGEPAWMAPTNGYGNILWVELPGTAPIYGEANNTYVYYFIQGGTSELYCSVQVPSNYIAGQQIYMWASGYSPSSSNTILMRTQATLIRVNTDSFASTTNQRTSTGVALTNVSANRLTLFGFDLTDSSGMINSVAVSACDIIKVRLYRDTDTDTADVRIIPGGTSVSFNLT